MGTRLPKRPDRNPRLLLPPGQSAIVHGRVTPNSMSWYPFISGSRASFLSKEGMCRKESNHYFIASGLNLCLQI